MALEQAASTLCLRMLPVSEANGSVGHVVTLAMPYSKEAQAGQVEVHSQTEGCLPATSYIYLESQPPR